MINSSALLPDFLGLSWALLSSMTLLTSFCVGVLSEDKYIPVPRKGRQQYLPLLAARRFKRVEVMYGIITVIPILVQASWLISCVIAACLTIPSPHGSQHSALFSHANVTFLLNSNSSFTYLQ